ncbi:MAG: hypothetical protein KKI14_00980, partial [Nanoarchaeota archaeon]|nr:hypothetical protein [Nanoarchaeota archaeon]
MKDSNKQNVVLYPDILQPFDTTEKKDWALLAFEYFNTRLEYTLSAVAVPPNTGIYKDNDMRGFVKMDIDSMRSALNREAYRLDLSKTKLCKNILGKVEPPSDKVLNQIHIEKDGTWAYSFLDLSIEGVNPDEAKIAPGIVRKGKIINHDKKITRLAKKAISV